MFPNKEDTAIKILLSTDILKSDIFVKIMLPLKQTNPDISMP